jgi:2'-5' RNA ligase
MPGIAIVAIPRQEDITWKVSSEKVPHLTLCFLGDQPNFPIGRVAQYVEHVASTSMHRFGLSVDRRGPLGPDNADVLFFNEDGTTRWLENIQSYLLQDEDIRKAYDSVAQFPKWTPHLTLGWPTAPAKPVPNDWGISWVSFDRIAIWTGDFTGPEFLLADRQWGVAQMSDNVLAGQAFIKHFGVKGMQWGVRKSSSSSSGKRTTPSSDHANAALLKANKKHTLTNEELAIVVKRKELEQRYSQLNPSRFKRGENVVKTIVATVGTIGSVVALANTPLGKAAISAVRKVILSAK